ncbi:MAG: hypothetical protein KF902_06370 [Phycisphaeraceae bacterium]|nr:hypothetical protein [Phycisphaeraceae bacterium]QYK48994.1 MAG: hypothetical protein KF838_03875 [Phycisphaeraceae bacterium]
MDATELRALRALAERDVWPVNELPEWIDVDLLRCLDVEGVIEGRYVTAHNNAKYPGDAPNITYSQSTWFSPLQKPSLAGPWENWVRPEGYDCWNPPREIRISDKGRAVLARAVRYSESKHPTDPEAEEVMARAAMFRASGADVYPGVLLVIRGDNFALRPVEDVDYSPGRDGIIGIAMWGLEANTSVIGEDGVAEGAVRMIAVDREQPRTGLSLADAWIARADVVRRVLSGSTLGESGMDAVMETAAIRQVVSVLRSQAVAVIALLPENATAARAALARVADGETPKVDDLNDAIQAILASAVVDRSESPAPPRTGATEDEVSGTSKSSNGAPKQRVLKDVHWTVLCEVAASLSPFEPALRANSKGLPKYDALLRRLRELEVEGLVERPLGERSGWCATEKGRQRLKDNGFNI